MLQAVKNHIPVQNSKIPAGIIAIDAIDDALKSSPYDEYNKNYAMNSDYWNEKSSGYKSSRC